ncbi:MAG: cytochrome c family protein [Desulfobacterales bacterium]|nr:cytochrome c family protein [Desulfobacterales bacterium]
MTSHRSPSPRAALLNTALAALMVAALIGCTSAASSPGDANAPRADIIRIDGLKQFGGLERPAVVFLHEKHTQALAPKNKECAACHLPVPDKKYMSTKYMRLKDESKGQVMEVYHTHCIDCHRQTTAAGEKSGPVVCAGCHADKQVASSWADIGMDKSLHYRHVKAQENKCEACHHQFDPTAKKLFYAKGKEETCRYCHLDRTVENVTSFRQAAHDQCIDCHRKQLAASKAAGPATCSGCHDAGLQKKIERVKEIPRLMRGQPDVTLVQAIPRGGQKLDPGARAKVVPFNHIAHEAANDSCRVCHHAGMAACGTCHSLQGSKEGKFVSLQTAMHRVTAQASCMGCHQSYLADKRCAGCHAAMPPRQPQDVSGCASCHVAPPADTTAQSDPKQIAAALLDMRRPVTATLPDDAIPEEVLIKALSNKYEPVKLPHRKIVHALQKNLAGSKLASYFHPAPGTLCQGCHHHSPVSAKPPACASCHGRSFDERNLFKPGLQAAYHLQCFECHAAMGIEKPVATDCTGCHKAKP